MKMNNASGCILALIIFATGTSCYRRDDCCENHIAGEDLNNCRKYEAEFKRLITAGKGMTVNDVQERLRSICEKIAGLSDREVALALYDDLLEMAICQPIPQSENYYERQNEYTKHWFIAYNAFMAAQLMRDKDYECWDKLFRFYGKYVDEICALEDVCKCASRNDFSTASTRKLNYLKGLRGNLDVWLHVMRDLKFPRLSQGLTEEQKADILRRFDELQKYTAEPPDCIGRKIEAK